VWLLLIELVVVVVVAKDALDALDMGATHRGLVAFETIFNRLQVVNLLYLGPGYGNRAETFLSYIHVELSR
jgi:hypothetical protein